MSNQPNTLLMTATFRQSIYSPSSLLNSSSNILISPRYSSLPKTTKIIFPIHNNHTSSSNTETNYSNRLTQNSGSPTPNRQQKQEKSESIYKNHETKHLLNRIRYLEGIIKDKDRRYKEELGKNNRLESLESTVSTSYRINAEKEHIKEKRIKELEDKVKELERVNGDQKTRYERKIKEMQEYMETHFVEIQSEIMDQEWMDSGDGFDETLTKSRLSKGVYLKH